MKITFTVKREGYPDFTDALEAPDGALTEAEIAAMTARHEAWREVVEAGSRLTEADVAALLEAEAKAAEATGAEAIATSED